MTHFMPHVSFYYHYVSDILTHCSSQCFSALLKHVILKVLELNGKSRLLVLKPFK